MSNIMTHSIVPLDKVNTNYKPSNIIHSGDSWAKTICLNEDMFLEITEKFEEKILATGKTSGVVSGSFEFTSKNSSLDAFAALHNVDYAVTFTKQSNGYKAVYKVTDTYDFAKEKDIYDNFAINFANNYCYGMQQSGFIKPFNITLTYTLQ